MQPVHAAPSSPRVSQEGSANGPPSAAPAQPGLSQRHADADVRRFFASAVPGNPASQPEGRLQARGPSDLSQSRAALPPPPASAPQD